MEKNGGQQQGRDITRFMGRMEKVVNASYFEVSQSN